MQLFLSLSDFTSFPWPNIRNQHNAIIHNYQYIYQNPKGEGERDVGDVWWGLELIYIGVAESEGVALNRGIVL